MKEHVEKKENSDTVIHGDIKNNESGDKPGNVVSLENTTGILIRENNEGKIDSPDKLIRENKGKKLIFRTNKAILRKTGMSTLMLKKGIV